MGKRNEPMLMSARRCVCGHAKNLHVRGVGPCVEHADARVTLCPCRAYESEEYRFGGPNYDWATTPDGP